MDIVAATMRALVIALAALLVVTATPASAAPPSYDSSGVACGAVTPGSAGCAVGRVERTSLTCDGHNVTYACSLTLRPSVTLTGVGCGILKVEDESGRALSGVWGCGIPGRALTISHAVFGDIPPAGRTTIVKATLCFDGFSEPTLGAATCQVWPAFVLFLPGEPVPDSQIEGRTAVKSFNVSADRGARYRDALPVCDANFGGACFPFDWNETRATIDVHDHEGRRLCWSAYEESEYGGSFMIANGCAPQTIDLLHLSGTLRVKAGVEAWQPPAIAGTVSVFFERTADP